MSLRKNYNDNSFFNDLELECPTSHDVVLQEGFLSTLIAFRMEYNKPMTITGTQAANDSEILLVCPSAKDKSLKQNISTHTIKPVIINLKLFDFLRVFMVKIDANAVIINKKKGSDNIEFKF